MGGNASLCRDRFHVSESRNGLKRKKAIRPGGPMKRERFRGRDTVFPIRSRNQDGRFTNAEPARDWRKLKTTVTKADLGGFQCRE